MEPRVKTTWVTGTIVNKENAIVGSCLSSLISVMIVGWFATIVFSTNIPLVVTLISIPVLLFSIMVVVVGFCEAYKEWNTYKNGKYVTQVEGVDYGNANQTSNSKTD